MSLIRKFSAPLSMRTSNARSQLASCANSEIAFFWLSLMNKLNDFRPCISA